jgi:RNA polymerase sigma-70 factor (ECF subfamily)
MQRRRRAGEPSHFDSLDRDETQDEGSPAAVDVASPSQPADEQLMDAWIDRRLRAALHRLPPSYRAIVVLREIEGLPTREVATITGISEANVKTRLHRARVMLRRELEAL